METALEEYLTEQQNAILSIQEAIGLGDSDELQAVRELDRIWTRFRSFILINIQNLNYVYKISVMGNLHTDARRTPT